MMDKINATTTTLPKIRLRVSYIPLEWMLKW